MKLGLVLECDVGGPDELVLTCLARRLKRGVEVVPIPLGSKEQLFLKGPETALQLIEASKCDLALIVWDLKPVWDPQKSCKCEHETAELRSKVKALPPKVACKIRLLCMTWELETWLIADERAVRAHLSKETHKAKFKSVKPLTKNDPKAFLDKICREHRGVRRRYEDTREAIQIALHIPDTSRLRTVDSFSRFSRLLTGNARAEFQATSDECKDLAYQALIMGRR